MIETFHFPNLTYFSKILQETIIKTEFIGIFLALFFFYHQELARTP